MAEHLLLVGMMGSGKTTVGRIVADRMRRPFYDSDEEVLARTGMSVPEIFRTRGVPAFRAEEKMVLATALASGVPSVIAVAGGAVIDPDSRRLIRRNGLTIWLRAVPATLARRVGQGEGRPLLEHDPAGTIARLDAVRRPVYQRIADAVVDVDGTRAVDAADRIARIGRGLMEDVCRRRS